MSALDPLWLLRKAPQLAGVGAEQLRELADVSEAHEVAPRHHLYLEGDASEHVFLIHGGRVKTYRATQDGRSLTLALHRAGSWCGECCLSGEGTRADSALVLKRAQLSKVPRNAFLAALTAASGGTARLVALFGAQRRALEDRLLVGLTSTAEARVAQVLLALTERDGIHVAAGVPQHELAALVGISRPTLSVVMARLEQQGLVGHEGRAIILADPLKLALLVSARGDRRLRRFVTRPSPATVKETPCSGG